jgi:hypothetical protein
VRIPTWRLVLTGAAIIILAVAGIGLATAADAPAAPTSQVTTAEDGSTAPAPANRAGTAGEAGMEGRAWRLLKAGRHLVHAEVTVTDRDGNLVNLQIDHGTVVSIGGGSLTISEAGGVSETVSTSDATIVRLGREKGDLGDVAVGAEVFVQSRVDGATVLAKRILVVPAAS